MGTRLSNFQSSPRNIYKPTMALGNQPPNLFLPLWDCSIEVEAGRRVGDTSTRDRLQGDPVCLPTLQCISMFCSRCHPPCQLTQHSVSPPLPCALLENTEVGWRVPPVDRSRAPTTCHFSRPMFGKFKVQKDYWCKHLGNICKVGVWEVIFISRVFLCVAGASLHGYRGCPVHRCRCLGHSVS